MPGCSPLPCGRGFGDGGGGGNAATKTKEVVDFLTQSDEDLMDYKDKGKATTGTPDGHRSATSTGSGTAPTGAEPKPKGKRIKMKSFKAMQQESREKNRGPLASLASRSPPIRAATPERAAPKQVHEHSSYDPCDPTDRVLPCKEDLARLMQSGAFSASWDEDEDERYSSEEDQPTQATGCVGCHFRQSCRHRRAALGRPVLSLLLPPLVGRVGMAVMCFGGALRHSKGGPPNGLTGTVRSARRNFRRGAHAAQYEGVTYNVQLWPNQLGKLIEGDLRVDVDETELEFLGLDELLPTEELEGLDYTEEDLEDDILRFARSFDHKGISPCDVREMITLRKERRAQEDGILEALRRNTTATANLQHEASEIGVGPAGAGSETKGARRNRRAKTKKRSGAAPPSMSRRRRPRAATSFSTGCE